MKNNFTPESDLEILLLDKSEIKELIKDIKSRFEVVLPSELIVPGIHSILVGILAEDIENKIIEGNNYKIKYDSLVNYSKFKENFIVEELNLPNIRDDKKHISSEELYKILFCKNIHKDFEEELLSLLKIYKDRNNDLSSELLAKNDFNNKSKIIAEAYYFKANLENNNSIVKNNKKLKV